MPVMLLAVAAGLPAVLMPKAATAAPPAVAPQTAAGIITVYHSPGIHFSSGRQYYNAGIAAGPDGALWFTNPGNNTIGRITPAGKVKDYANKTIRNPWAITTGPDAAVWFTNFETNTIGRITTRGAVTAFPAAANRAMGLAVSPYGTLWYTNWSLIPENSCSWSIGRITTSGKSACYQDPKVIYPSYIAAGPDGAMWFTIGGQNGSGHAIGRIDRFHHITTYPTGGDLPRWITLGRDHALWFTSMDSDAIGRITASGVLSRFTGPAISRPTGIAAGPDGALWFINAGTRSIGRITTKGQVTTYPGPPGLAAGISTDITAGPDGAIWFTMYDNTIGRITTSVTPWIFSKTPASGPPGTQVTILGRNLAHATQVAFNGTPATILADASTYLVTIVPPGATSGRIAITTPAGTATQNGWFTVTRAIPHLR